MTTFKPWGPGDPLYDRGNHPHSGYLYCWRDDSLTEKCNCADRADWPGQAQGHLDEGDELGVFIAEIKAARTESEEAS